MASLNVEDKEDSILLIYQIDDEAEIPQIDFDWKNLIRR